MTTAPAPSPNNMHVFLSSQSTHLLNASAPNTRALLKVPLLRNCPAVTVANKKPEHAAVMSNATAPREHPEKQSILKTKFQGLEPN